MKSIGKMVVLVGTLIVSAFMVGTGSAAEDDLAPLNGSRSYVRVGPKGGPYATFASHRRTNSCQAA